MSRTRRGLTTALVVAVVAVGCTRPGDPDEVAPSPTSAAPLPSAAEAPAVLRWGLGADPGSLDPRLAGTPDERLLAGALFDGLTTLARDGSAVPALAADWEVDEAGTTWTFRLAPGSTWHDGTPVVADDVVRGWSRVLDPTLAPSPAASLLADVVGAASVATDGSLAGVRAPDATTVEVELRRPDPELPRLVAHPGLSPVPPPAVVDAAALDEAPVGNGPFALAEPWVHDQFLRLAAVDDHPRPAAVDELVLRIYRGDDTGQQRYDDLEAGRIAVTSVPPGRRDEVVAARGVSIAGGPGVHDELTAVASLLLLDVRRPPLDDVEVRRAVSMLVDRAAAARTTAGDRVEARSLVPRTVADAPVGSCPWCRYDPTFAATKLATARGGDDGGDLPPITLLTSSDELHRGIADRLAEGLADNGLPTDVRAPAAGDYLAIAEEGGANAVRLAWVPQTATLGPWAAGLFAQDAIGRRLTGFGPPELDALVAATATADPLARRAAERDIVRLVLDRAVVVPLLHYPDDLVTDTGVEGLVRSPAGDVELTTVRLVEDGDTAPG